MDQSNDETDLQLLLAHSPGQPLIWKRFLQTLNRRLNGDSAFMLVTDLENTANNHFLFSVNIEAEFQLQYETKLNRDDGFNRLLSKHPYCVFYSQALDEMMSETGGSVFAMPPDQPYGFGVSIPCNHKHALSLRVHRGTPYNDGEQQRATEFLQGLLPALQDAIHAEQRHKIQSQLRHLLGKRFDSYMIVDRQLNILFSDPLFLTIIEQMDCVQISERRFGMSNPAIENRLLTLIEHNQSASIHNQCRACQISLTPIASLTNLYPWECYRDGFILAFTHDKEANPAVERLMEIYRLSKCEAVCALQFMQQPSIADIAAHTFRSQETVRNHLKHAMQKMDAHSQAELMKKLISLASL